MNKIAAVYKIVGFAGLRYRGLVRRYGHRRLVIDFGGLRLCGDPFHDDIIAILRELGRVGGRLAVCRSAPWYTAVLVMYRRWFRVVDGHRPAAADGGPQTPNQALAQVSVAAVLLSCLVR